VGSLAQYLHSAVWRDWFDASAAQLSAAAFWLAVLQIIFVNVLLSGDNAVVIAMACRGLPAPQRRWGIVLGAGAAVVFRVIFVGVVAELMLLPYLKLIGGIALVIIAAKLIVPDDPDTDEIKGAAHLWRAVAIIVVADIVMSLDNVIAIAAIAQGNLLLLVIGLAVSIPLIMAGAALIAVLLDRFPILIWAGSALLGWVAGSVIATDPAVTKHLAAAFGETMAHEVALASASAAALLAIAAGGLWSRLHAHTRIRGEVAARAEDNAA
jgi:YjbE family integral membrane protein